MQFVSYDLEIVFEQPGRNPPPLSPGFGWLVSWFFISTPVHILQVETLAVEMLG